MKILMTTFALVVAAAPAMAGPDFVTPNPRPRALAASSGVREVAPMDDILFDFDSDALSAVAWQQLGSAATWLKHHPDFHLVLEGYTDGSGYRFYNEDLATRRAAAARRHLIGLGVPSARIVIVVYGEAASRAQQDALERRVVLYATDQTPKEIATASIARKHALSAVWVERDTLFSQRRAVQPVLVGTR
jgi:outer membrane protein OmpA-like peptidoglycan-associated protein